MYPRLFFTLGLASALLLTACGQTPSSAPQMPLRPEPKSTLGLYALQINGSTGTSPDASIQTVLPQGQEIPVNQLAFKRVSMSNLVDVAGQVVHMSATFEITNNTGKVIGLPTFVPVDTDGSFATWGEGPFRNVKTRTGTPATPAGFRIEVAHQESGGVIQPDPRATPLVNHLDTGGLVLTLPSGTTAPGIAHQAWQTATLPVGASQRVTFGVEVPLKGTDISDNDPFSFSLVFAVTDTPAVLDVTPISEVQGSTPSGDALSPKNNQQVTVEGIVTSGAALHSNLKGFFLQEEGIDADRDPTTSEGLFVDCSGPCPALTEGDRIRVQGTVVETGGRTTLNAQIATLTVLSSHLPLPAITPLTLPLPVASRERLEGMRVSVQGLVNNLDSLQQEGSLDVAASNLLAFTQQNNPDPVGFAAFQKARPDQTLRIDDPTESQFPQELFGPNHQPLSNANALRDGDQVEVQGLLTSSGGGTGPDPYRVLTTPPDFTVTPLNPRPAVAPQLQGALKVGTVSAMQYFTALSKTNSGCTSNGTLATPAGGAENCAEFLRQQSKLVKTILALNPDVLGVLDLQNNYPLGSSSAMSRLVQALNQDVGSNQYTYINPGQTVGQQDTSMGFIYNATHVDPVGQLAILDDRYDARYLEACNQPTWAQTFHFGGGHPRLGGQLDGLKLKICAVFGGRFSHGLTPILTAQPGVNKL